MHAPSGVTWQYELPDVTLHSDGGPGGGGDEQRSPEEAGMEDGRIAR
jgi:hypothetical protein